MTTTPRTPASDAATAILSSRTALSADRRLDSSLAIVLVGLANHADPDPDIVAAYSQRAGRPSSGTTAASAQYPPGGRVA